MYLPPSLTTTEDPGYTTNVEVGSSIIAGPWTLAPTNRESPEKIAVFSEVCPKFTIFCPENEYFNDFD